MEHKPDSIFEAAASILSEENLQAYADVLDKLIGGMIGVKAKVAKGKTGTDLIVTIDNSKFTVSKESDGVYVKAHAGQSGGGGDNMGPFKNSQAFAKALKRGDYA